MRKFKLYSVLDLGLGIFAGMQLAGLAFYIPLFLCYKNRGFYAISEGDSFTWAIYRKRKISWSNVTRVSVINQRVRMEEKPSISFALEIQGRNKQVKLHFKEKSGILFKQELKQRLKLF